jgi:glucokinase
LSAYTGYAIGLDIGGTNMVAGVIAGNDGRVIYRHSVPTDSRHGIDDGLNRIGELIERILEKAELSSHLIAGIGIGSSGPVDSNKGLIQNPYTLPGWDNLPINRYLNERFGLPCCLLIDTHVAALGEHWVGAARGTQHMLYLTFGTGIGCGIILHNQLYRGVGLTSGDVGHHVIDLNGPPCYCGGKGCWEMLAAAPAIARYAAENAPENSLLLQMAAQDRQNITPLLVSQASQQGDAFAQGVMERTAHYIGVGIANLITIFSPQVVVLGGGIMGSWPLFAPTALKELQRCAAMVPLDQIRIVTAGLGLNAGITGAARAVLAMQAGDLERLFPSSS